MNITSKNPRQKQNILFLLEQDNSEYESHVDGGIQVVKYSPKNAYPVLAIFKDKQKDAFSHYRYSSNEERDLKIIKAVEDYKKTKKIKAERKANAKPIEVKVGDIVYTSYGYEQTNIDFYQIVGLVGKSTAEYVSIGSKVVETTSWCSADVTPDTSIKGNNIQRGRIGQYGVKIGSLHASVISPNSKLHSSWGH